MKYVMERSAYVEFDAPQSVHAVTLVRFAPTKTQRPEFIAVQLNVFHDLGDIVTAIKFHMCDRKVFTNCINLCPPLPYSGKLRLTTRPQCSCAHQVFADLLTLHALPAVHGIPSVRVLPLDSADPAFLTILGPVMPLMPRVAFPEASTAKAPIPEMVYVAFLWALRAGATIPIVAVMTLLAAYTACFAILVPLVVGLGASLAALGALRTVFGPVMGLCSSLMAVGALLTVLRPVMGSRATLIALGVSLAVFGPALVSCLAARIARAPPPVMKTKYAFPGHCSSDSLTISLPTFRIDLGRGYAAGAYLS